MANRRKDILDSTKITQTLGQLVLRIEERFPNSGLLGVARLLYQLSEESDETAVFDEQSSVFVCATF